MGKTLTITLIFMGFFAGSAMAESHGEAVRNPAGAPNFLIDKGLGESLDPQELQGFVHNRKERKRDLNGEIEGGLYPAGKPSEFQSITTHHRRNL